MTTWEQLVAIGIVADDLTVAGIARYAGVHAADAHDALRRATQATVVGPDGIIDHTARVRLVADLPTERVAEVHAAVARHLFAGGPERLRDAVRHARAAGTLVALDELVAMAHHGGTMSLALGDYASAEDLLSLASEFDWADDMATRAERLCSLAAAADGLGKVTDARRHLAHAVSLAELSGAGEIAARAAVQYTLPVDWYAGDARAAGLLARAAAMDIGDDSHVMVEAARALVESRIPIEATEHHQFAWVTRPDVGQTIAERALARSRGCGDDVRSLALLAWRSTHRAPLFLDRRRDASTEALALAQRLRHPAHQVEAAIWLAVDAIESADRPLFDQALSVARWVAARDGNPRLLWRAYTLAAGAAHLDGDLDAAREFRASARRAGEPIDSPGWLGAELLLYAEEVLAGGLQSDAIATLRVDEHLPVLANPLGRAVAALAWAADGADDVAERLVRRALRQLEAEASYLLLLTRCAAVVEHLDRPQLARDLLDRLAPWSGHIAVDSNGWWCDGPVAYWLAVLHHRLGDDREARRHLDEAERLSLAINDVRTLNRSEQMRRSLRHSDRPAPLDVSLTTRELEVLLQLAAGATNAQIASRLSYSLSTIRNDTVAVYRKLAVGGRAEAVAKATELGLLRPHPHGGLTVGVQGLEP